MRPMIPAAVRHPEGVDDIERRVSMEASENTAPSARSSPTGLHRVDPARVSETLAADGSAEGYARLSLMVGTIFERLVSEPGRGRG